MLLQIATQTITDSDAAPMLEVQLELSGPEVVWSPELGEGAGGVRAMLLDWVKRYFEIGTLMKRLDSGEGEGQGRGGRAAHCGFIALQCDGPSAAYHPASFPRYSLCPSHVWPASSRFPPLPLFRPGTYTKELDEDVRIREALAGVQMALLETEERCAAFRQQYVKYSHLWQVDMQAALREFLVAGAAGSPTGAAATAGVEHAAGPSLESFAAEIAKYKAIQDEVQALPSNTAVGWIKVDARPLKQALLTWNSKWVYLFMRHLRGEVRDGGRRAAQRHERVARQLDALLLPCNTSSALHCIPAPPTPPTHPPTHPTPPHPTLLLPCRWRAPCRSSTPSWPLPTPRWMRAWRRTRAPCPPCPPCAAAACRPRLRPRRAACPLPRRALLGGWRTLGTLMRLPAPCSRLCSAPQPQLLLPPFSAAVQHHQPA